jgi:hypothetical protein
LVEHWCEEPGVEGSSPSRTTKNLFMSKLYRVGDLVSILKSYNPTEYYYCRIVDIIDDERMTSKTCSCCGTIKYD